MKQKRCVTGESKYEIKNNNLINSKSPPPKIQPSVAQRRDIVSRLMAHSQLGSAAGMIMQKTATDSSPEKQPQHHLMNSKVYDWNKDTKITKTVLNEQYISKTIDSYPEIVDFFKDQVAVIDEKNSNLNSVSVVTENEQTTNISFDENYVDLAGFYIMNDNTNCSSNIFDQINDFNGLITSAIASSTDQTDSNDNYQSSYNFMHDNFNIHTENSGPLQPSIIEWNENQSNNNNNLYNTFPNDFVSL